MARDRFDEQLSQLNTQLLKMNALVERALNNAIIVLETRNIQLAQEVIESDSDVNALERDIEAQCLKLILREQPVAKDLHKISAALKMITDIERIGDQAADICRIVIDMAEADPYPLDRVPHLMPLGKATVEMVGTSIDAFIAQDLDKVKKVIADDDKVDDLFFVVKSELLAWMRRLNDADVVAVDLLLIAKYFERIADHAQNTAEWVQYSLTGEHKGVRYYGQKRSS